MKKSIIVLFGLFNMMLCQAHTPTWTDGIACIIYSHCTSCHNPKGIAPFSLVTYNDVFQNRYSIAASVLSKSMPPFPASQEKQQYAHANTLNSHEIQEIVDWVNNFAPLGDANNIPEPPQFDTDYQISSPDSIAKIPTYTITSNNDVYRMFVVPMLNNEQRIIEEIEVYPGNREIVHHALVFQDTSMMPFTMDQNDPLPGYSAFGGTGSPTSKLITAYTPGQAAFKFAPGFGSVIQPRSYIVIQMHYPSGASGQSDSTQVRIRFGPPNLRNVNTVAALNHGSTLIDGPLFIPANSVRTFHNRITNPTNRTLTGIMPHMHLIGKSVKAIAVKPDMDTITLIDIPEWDFHWQHFYQFQKPIFLPAGTVLYGEATYDNTINNRFNPNNPPQDVTLGEGTNDEMFLIYFNLSAYNQGDTNIVIDTSSHITHDTACYLRANPPSIQETEIKIFPNPAKEYINISVPDHQFTLCIFDANGKKIIYKGGISNSIQLPTTSLSRGVYYVKLDLDSGEIHYRKIVIE